MTSNITLAAAAAALALAWSFSACGGEDDQDAKPSGNPGVSLQRDATTGSVGGKTEAVVKAAYRRHLAAFLEGRANDYCSGVTPAAARQTTYLTLPQSKSCLLAMRKIAKLNPPRTLKETQISIADVEIRDTVAVLKITRAGRPTSSVELRLVGGGWKLHDMGSRSPAAS